MTIMKEVKALKSIYRAHRQGWSNDREKSMKHAARIPLWMIFDKEKSRYFDPNMDKHEEKKELLNFLKKHPECSLKDQ